MRSKYVAIFAAAVVAASVFAMACGEDDDTAAPTPPAPTATPQVSEPETGPSGIRSVDEAIAAMRGGDLQAVIDQLIYRQEACAPVAEGLGGPPECGTGEATGTIVDVAFFASCEGYWVREHQAEMNLARFVEGDIELYGVFQSDGRRFGGADYVAIFAAEREEGTLAEALFLTEEGITGVDYGCGGAPAQYVQLGGYDDVIVAPGS